MDKRTLIFFISLSFTLFAVNIVFNYWEQQKNHEWYAQQKAKRDKEQTELLAHISNNQASPSALPLANIYTDAEGKTFIAEGVISGNNIVVISWTKTLPARVFYRKPGETTPPQKLALASTAKEGEPAIYSTPEAQPLQAASMPKLGSYEVQLVASTGDAQKPTEVFLGEYRDAHILLPIDKLAKLNPEEYRKELPKKNLLVLFKQAEQYLPVGVYITKEKSFVPLNRFTEIAALLAKPEKKEAVAKEVSKEEKFFVLENKYQQLVFSNKGGALAEINLPFRTPENQRSVVKEVGIDRDMVSEEPQNAKFPSRPFYTPATSPQGPHTLNAGGKLGGYYPLLRRTLIPRRASEVVTISPAFYALNIVSEFPEVAELMYEVKHFDKKTIVFEAQQPHRRITKTFSIPGDDLDAPYCINLKVEVEGDSRGLWITTGVPEVEWQSTKVPPALKYRITRQGKSEVENLTLPTDVTLVSSTNPDWLCNSNGFLGVILDPLTEVAPGYKAIAIPGALAPTRLLELDQGYERFKAENFPGYAMQLPLKPGGKPAEFRVFAGPFATQILRTVDATFSDPTTGYNPDYIASQSFHGWFSFISEPFAKFLFFLMNFFHQITNSWALSIVLLTVALRLLLFPLNSWSMRSLTKMQEIAPEMKRIQEKYKKDPKKLQIAIANLYRETGANPFSGCLPMLIQMPFLIGMFDLLKSTFELRGAVFIPGWIDNLAAPDVLFSWQQPIWYIGTEFHLLPILTGLAMFLQQRVASATAMKNANEMTEQQRQQRAMGNMLPIIFAAMFYHMASGLNLYWLSSTFLGMLQQWWTTRSMKKEKANKEALKPAK